MGVPIPFLIPARIAKKASTFLLIGVVGALFDYGTRTLLLHLGIPAFTARGCSYIVGSVVAYYLNSFYTFDGNRSASEKLRAAVVYLFCFAVAVVFDFTVRKLYPDASHILFISWFISQAAATLCNFTLQNFWVFRSSGNTRIKEN
ncbi:GtrA family protein [Corynebacterium resistens]|uniref:GtrA family protein n=1 Tax=Corynebacterium resistens TaxID=258224 RepID=UPI0001E29019|nr:GtrA family protein [Corynebacterium resistens]